MLHVSQRSLKGVFGDLYAMTSKKDPYTSDISYKFFFIKTTVKLLFIFIETRLFIVKLSMLWLEFGESTFHRIQTGREKPTYRSSALDIGTIETPRLIL